METVLKTVKRYPEYLDSGVEWMGQIPNYWDLIKLKHLFKEKSIIHDINLPAGSISFGEIVTKDDRKIPKSTKESYQVLSKGEFLVNPLNLNYDLKSLRIGLSEIDVVVSSGYIVLQNHKEINKRYYKYFLHRYDVSFMKLLGSGVRQTINFNNISNSLLANPPLPEQTAIANFLDDKTEKIDRAVSIKEKQIALLKERRQIIIQELVTGKKVWNEEKQAWEKPEKTIDSGVEWIGEIPEEWEVVPIRRLVDVRDGTHDTPTYIDENENSHFLVTSKDFKGNDIDFSNAKSISKKDYIEIAKRSGVDNGDVIMSMIGGNIGKSVIANYKTDYAIKNVGLFKTYGDLILSKYIRFYLQSGLLDIQIELNSRGGAQGFLSLGDLRNLKFLKVPSEMLSNAVFHIEESSEKIDQAISIKEREIEKLKEYKASLVNDVVLGRVKVS